MASEKGVMLLNFWVSPFGQRACIALAEKGVQYEYKEENLAEKSELLLKSNPVLFVPHRMEQLAMISIIMIYSKLKSLGHNSIVAKLKPTSGIFINFVCVKLCNNIT
jgi:Glutathione S-transferase, N-terminal domain